MARLVQIIRSDLKSEDLVWKYPEEDFNSLTQLIVQQSQEAIFYLNGQARDLFTPGNYKLSSQNLPIITDLLKMTITDKSPFHCTVYFVNKTQQMAVKWGTPEKVQINCTQGGITKTFDIGMRGEYFYEIVNAKKLINTTVGAREGLTRDKLTELIRSIIITYTKDNISRIISQNNISIFEVDQHLVEISNLLLPEIQEQVDEYGIFIKKFLVSAIVKPEDNPDYIALKNFGARSAAVELEALLQQKKASIEADTKAYERRTQGYTYHEERGYDVADAAAANEGVGQYSNMGIGLGMMAGVSGVVKDVTNSAISNVAPTQPVQPTPVPEDMMVCVACKEIVPAGKFCLKCGSKQAVVCPNCGKELPEGAKFCLECGTRI